MSHTSVSNEFVLERLNWRYAVKRFNPEKKVSEEDWATLERALIFAPSSNGLQPYKFIVVTDADLKDKLKEAAYGQRQLTDASHVVIFAYKNKLTDADVDEFVDLIVKTRGVERESLADYEKSMKTSSKRAVDNGYSETANSRQAYIALGFLLETAAILGIDACPMEGFDAKKFNEILGLEDYSAVALCPVGYRDAENDWLAPLAKVRFPKEKLIDRR